ncbi:MAG: CDP-glycerol glycerophosphotransferase family protein [Lachnospiraceae bacterium]|nr:CDP-glycerol glycerophosphotransferase family protein [Lachnospiraceae bacterium]
MKKAGIAFFLKVVLPLWYRIACLFEKKQASVLFLEIRYREITDNLRLLQKACEKQEGMRSEVFFLQTGEGSMASYLRRCLSMVRYLARAKVVFVDESSDVLAAIPIRKETSVVQCWHACGAFKRFGHGIGKLEREYYGPYAFVTVSSPTMVPFYADAMNQPAEKILPLGISRTDRFFDEAFCRDSREKVEKMIPETKGKKVILLAPTFRGNVANAKMPPLPDLSYMKEALGDWCVMLFKGHPAFPEKIRVPEDAADFCFDVSGRLSIEELMPAADYCITDYSSLIFEFALFDRPILFFAPDLSDYDDKRGFYHSIQDLDAGEIYRDTKELTEGLVSELSCNEQGMREESAKRLSAFREKFMQSCDGHATERIMERAGLFAKSSKG